MPSAEREQRIKLGQVVETETAQPVSMQVRSRLWMPWGRIAIQHEAMAHAVRGEAASLPAETSLGPLIQPEVEAGLVCVCATAFALEALYIELTDPALRIVPSDLRDSWTARRTRRGGRIEETLKRAVDTSALPSILRQDLDQLFQARGNAVHFVGKFQPMALHPLGTDVSPVQLMYSAESATRAVDLLVQILTACRDHPKQPAKSWSEQMRYPFDLVLTDREAAS
jgi:hypothetical protein